MKKTLITTAILAAITAAAMTIPAFAGTWKTDNGKWWYDNGDGTWPQNQWQWIDGNEDGLAESYYFDPNGYLVVSATTPDGYTVNESGAWVVNGQVQQTVSAQNTNAKAEWADAYASFLSSYNTKVKYGKKCFQLIYIDNDSIPELFIQNSSANHHEGAALYTYHNGQVTELGEFGNCDGFQYLEKQNYFYWGDSGTGLFLYEFYQLANGRAVLLNHYEFLETYQNGALASVTYEKNGVKLSQAEYRNSLNADIGNQASYKNASVKNALEITAGNIQKMQENAAFAIR